MARTGMEITWKLPVSYALMEALDLRAAGSCIVASRPVEVEMRM